MKILNQMLEMTISSPTTLDELLATFYIARKQRYFLYHTRSISVNGRIATQSMPLSANDQLQIKLQQQADTITAWELPLDISYEDEIFLIVNKPSGILVHSDGVNQTHTLCNAVKQYFDQTKQLCLVRPIHRLDMETSGLMIFCKEPFFQPMLDHLLETKHIHREYQALVKGVLRQSAFDIHAPLARDRHNAKKMRVDPHGKTARTMVTLEQQQAQFALVHCRLFTGRTHQIRVHLASIQHPILADPLYGQPDARIKRCALHASSITFYHPLLENNMTITCDLPADMQSLIKR